MGNRKQPFGYKMELGQIVTHPQEAPVVTDIFKDYALGASYKELVEGLRKHEIAYDADKPWNKNMVARILEDSRYTGEKGFPALIDTALLERVKELRSAKQTAPEKTEAQKLLRRLSGKAATEDMERQVLHLLNRLIQKPELIVQPTAQVKNEPVTPLQAQLRELLDTPGTDVDEDGARALAIQIAVAQYQQIDSGEYETIRLQRLFSDHDILEAIDTSLLQASVSAIKPQRDGSLRLVLKNKQIIGRSKSL